MSIILINKTLFFFSLSQVLSFSFILFLSFKASRESLFLLLLHEVKLVHFCNHKIYQLLLPSNITEMIEMTEYLCKILLMHRNSHKNSYTFIKPTSSGETTVDWVKFINLFSAALYENKNQIKILNQIPRSV